MKPLRQYFEVITSGRIVLWCYLIWYVATVAWHFDTDPRLWLNALGVGALIGCGLTLSVCGQDANSLDRWQVFRLFLIPFSVSSFSSLIKDKGFILVFSPDPVEVISDVAACVLFVAGVIAVKRRRKVETVTEALSESRASRLPR